MQKEIRRNFRNTRKANKLKRGKFYTFVSPVFDHPIHTEPDIMGKVIGLLPGGAMVMYLDSIPFPHKRMGCNWMMIRINYGELFGYVGCPYDTTEGFQAHNFFKLVRD